MQRVSAGLVTPDAFRRIAADAALVMQPSDRIIVLLNSTTGTKVANVADVADGQFFRVLLNARSGGAYTLACSNLAGTAGTVTFDAAAEAAEFFKLSGVIYNLSLTGATFA